MCASGWSTLPEAQSDEPLKWELDCSHTTSPYLSTLWTLVHVGCLALAPAGWQWDLSATVRGVTECTEGGFGRPGVVMCGLQTLCGTCCPFFLTCDTLRFDLQFEEQSKTILVQKSSNRIVYDSFHKTQLLGNWFEYTCKDHETLQIPFFWR